MRVVKIIPFFMLCVAAQSISVDIGSDTAVTRFNTRQIVANGDRIAGFAALAAGFNVAGFNATGTFDAFFPVIGPVSLGFGNLILNQDLVFHALSNISKLGRIIGQGHSIELASNMSCIPTGFGGACSISLIDSVSTGDDVFSVDWNSTNTSVAIGRNDAGGDELQVFSWDGASLVLITGVSLGADVFSVNWHPTNSWIAVGRDGAGGGTAELYLYSFDGVTLTLLDSVDLGGPGNAVNDVAWDPSGDYLAVATDSNTQELIVYDVSAGTFGASVTVDLVADANSVSWDSTGGFVVVGLDANAGAELLVYSFTIGPLALTLNATAEIGAQVNTVDWCKRAPDTDIIAIGLNSGSDRLQLYRHATGSLTNLPTSLGISTIVNSVHWHPVSACLAAGLDNNGLEVQTFAFQNDTLTLDSGAEIGSNVNSVRWSRGDGDYLAIGDNVNDLSIYQFDSNFTDITNVIFADVSLFMNSNLTLRNTSITFNGECIIDGRGGVLTLAPTFTLILGEQSSILLKDILIEGIAPEHIRGLDEQSTFSLQRATFVLDENFTFSIGRLDILSDFKIAGPNTAFIYSSDQQSTIRGGFLNPDDECSPFYSGSLILDDDVTFSYAPASNSATLLNLESQFSTIFLNGGNIFAETLTLTKGRLQVDGESTLQAGTSISFGDGIADNNLVVNILPAASLNIIGTLINNNI